MTYEIKGTFFILSNNNQLIMKEKSREDTHCTLKAILGTQSDLSQGKDHKIDTNTMTTLLVNRKKHVHLLEKIKTGCEVVVQGTVVMNSKSFHPIYVSDIKEKKQ